MGIALRTAAKRVCRKDDAVLVGAVARINVGAECKEIYAPVRSALVSTTGGRAPYPNQANAAFKFNAYRLHHPLFCFFANFR